MSREDDFASGGRVQPTVARPWQSDGRSHLATSTSALSNSLARIRVRWKVSLARSRSPAAPRPGPEDSHAFSVEGAKVATDVRGRDGRGAGLEGLGQGHGD